MNKKVLYGILFTSIFILSSVALIAQPARGGTFGVPDAAKGMDTETEVKVYDKDGWISALGTDPDDRVNQMHGNYKKGYSSNADDVGAKSKSHINDWEEDDESIAFLTDFLLYSKLDESIRLDGDEYDRTGDGISDLNTYWDAIDFATKTISGLGGFEVGPDKNGAGGYNTSLIGAVYQSLTGMIDQGLGAVVDGLNAASSLINLTQGLIYIGGGVGLGGRVPTNTPGLEAYASHRGTYLSTMTKAEVGALYGKKYDGVILERDLWYWADEGDYESDADEEEAEVPFIEDPEDVYDSYTYFKGMTEALFAQAEIIIDDWTNLIRSTGVANGTGVSPTIKQVMYGLNATFGINVNCNNTHTPIPAVPGFAGNAWNMLNSTLWSKLVPSLADQAAEGNELALKYCVLLGHPLFSAYPGFGTFGADAVMTTWYIVWNALKFKLVEFFKDKIPDKAEYLITLFRSGLPAHQDVENWLDDVVEEFDIDDDVLFNTDKLEQVGTEMWPMSITEQRQFYVDVSVDGKEVTIEIEWETGVMVDPDGPTEGATEQRDDYEMVMVYSDTGSQSSITYQGSEPFYKIESLAPVIPGYEISILLGAAAISALALIYVVMKKRRM